MFSQYDNYIVAVTIDSSFYRQGNIFAVLIVGVYLVLASCCMFYMLSRVMKEKYEKKDNKEAVPYFTELLLAMGKEE